MTNKERVEINLNTIISLTRSLAQAESAETISMLKNNREIVIKQTLDLIKD